MDKIGKNGNNYAITVLYFSENNYTDLTFFGIHISVLFRHSGCKF